MTDEEYDDFLYGAVAAVAGLWGDLRAGRSMSRADKLVLLDNLDRQFKLLRFLEEHPEEDDG